LETLITSSPEEAAAFIRAGRLAAFPTETVYGLGADAFDSVAARTVYEVKGRPVDNPMIVHLADVSAIPDVVATIPGYAEDLVSAFVPGPLTLVLTKDPRVPDSVTAGLNTVGVRIPSHPVAQDFLTACDRPVAAPSANRSGRPSPTSWQSVAEDLRGLIPCILKGDRSTVGLESSVVDCTGAFPMLLRVGAISLESLRGVIPSLQPSSTAGDLARRSPGLRHRHYAPTARVRFFDDSALADRGTKAYIGTSEPTRREGFDEVLVCSDLDQYAFELFDFFRRCDRKAIQTVYCERPEPSGIGSAILDRIARAARGHMKPDITD
jgi:L-threonylcarbamoyladenylate synthase